MNQSMIKKSILTSAISIALASPYAIAAPDLLPVTNMEFGGTVYSAGGSFNSAGTLVPFDPDTALVVDPDGVRSPAPGFDPLSASGNIFSYDPFFNFPWEGRQQTDYLTNTDSFAFVFDDVGSDCSAPTGVTKSSGPCSLQGSYDYDATLAAMTDEQIAIGMFFNWSVNEDIAVIDIFNCDANDSCTGTGVEMANGPFAGSKPVFNAGLSCSSDGLVTTAIDTPVSIDIAMDVLGTDVPPSNCTNPTDPIDPENPAGLKVDSVGSPTPGGGTAIVNGTVIDYTPMGGFEGSDTVTINVSDDTGGTSVITYIVQVGGQLQNNFTMLDVNGGIIGGTNDVDIVWDEVTYSDPTIIPGSDNGDGFGIPAEATPVMTIASPTPFRGFRWYAKNVRVYQGPVKLKFDIACTEADYNAYDATTNPTAADCSANPLPPINTGERYIKMELEAGETGAHMIFDWGKDLATSSCGLQNCEIDVVNVWNADDVWPDDIRGDGYNELYTGAVGVPPKFDTTWDLVSVAATPGAVIGTPMIDGAFQGSNANFNYKPLEADTADQTYTGTIPDTEAGSSMGLMTLLAGIFSIIGFRRQVNRKVKQ